MPKVWYVAEAARGHAYPGHPECPDRVLEAAKFLEGLKFSKWAEARQLRTFPTVPEAALLAVHTQQYLDELRASLAQVTQPTALRDPDDPDGCTFATPSTWEDALKAASAAVALVDAVISSTPGASSSGSSGRAEGGGGNTSGSSGSGPTNGAAAAGAAREGPAGAAAPADAAVCGFSICRPPGHHATPSEGMGFCLLNNAAVAARHAQRAHGLERILILDWDVHHGNGTQDIFYDDPSVLFIDIHRAGVWPDTGAADGTGAGAGEGTTINVPLPQHSGHAAALRAMEEVVGPAARRFGPQLIIVSAGYDAHWRDPLECLQYQSATYHALASAVLALAQELCGGRCLFLLEGGYHLEAVAESVGETMLGLLGRPPLTPVLDSAALPGGLPEPLGEVGTALRRVRRLHGLAFSSQTELAAAAAGAAAQ